MDRMRVDLEHYKRKDQLNTEEKQALNDQIAALKELVRIQKDQLAALVNADTASATAISELKKQIEGLEKIIKEYDKQVERLTLQRNFWRTLARVGVVTAAVVGVVVGYVLGRK